jgi:membrane protein DedA with SNARE-associated domain
MFDQLVDVVENASVWAYAAVALIAALDALLPIVPSETAVITAGVVAATGNLELALVVACAAVGAAIGDNTAYAIGRRYGSHVARRGRGLAAADKLAWAERRLAERGGELLVVARFVPGGRIAVTLTAGATRFRWRRFVVLDALAALLWATYAALLGYFGGELFKEHPWRGLGLALAIALSSVVVVEVVRRLRRR